MQSGRSWLGSRPYGTFRRRRPFSFSFLFFFFAFAPHTSRTVSFATPFFGGLAYQHQCRPYFLPCLSSQTCVWVSPLSSFPPLPFPPLFAPCQPYMLAYVVTWEPKAQQTPTSPSVNVSPARILTRTLSSPARDIFVPPAQSYPPAATVRLPPLFGPINACPRFPFLYGPCVPPLPIHIRRCFLFPHSWVVPPPTFFHLIIAKSADGLSRNSGC